eukprot:3988837-Alexandrium_andersonii.AAC.1
MTWPRGWSGETTTSPPRAAAVAVVVALLAIGVRGVRVVRRASPVLGHPTTRKGRRTLPWAKPPRA